ncbi:MAG: hypothetical protein ABI221_02920 [Candidatus Saccharimonadales bacterium]
MTSEQTDNQKIMHMIQTVGDNLSEFIRTADSRFLGIENRIDRVQNTLGTLETRLTNVEERLGAVEARLTNVEERLGAVEARLTSVEERLGTLETSMVDVRERLGVLETSMVDVREQISALETGMVNVGERLFRVEALEEHNGEGINKLAEAMMVHRKRTNLVPSMSARLRERAVEAKTIKLAVRETSLQVHNHEKRLTRLEATT